MNMCVHQTLNTRLYSLLQVLYKTTKYIKAADIRRGMAAGGVVGGAVCRRKEGAQVQQ